MSEKILYQCPECGNVRLVEGPPDEPNAGRICQAGEGASLCLASMVQVWPAPSLWVEVGRWLPNDGDEVIAWAHEYWYPAIRRKGQWWSSENEDVVIVDVTHWMPAPSAPEEVSP